MSASGMSSKSSNSEYSAQMNEQPAPVNPRRLTLKQLVAEVSPKVSRQHTPRQQTIDDILMDYLDRDSDKL